MSRYVKKSFRDAYGIRHYVTGKTEEEAIVKRERLRMKLEAQSHSSVLFADWSEIALDTYKPNVSDKYRNQMRTRLTKHIIPVIGKKPLSRISLIDCQRILNNISSMSRSTITKVDQELKFYFEKAIDSNLLDKNPAEKTVRPNGYTHKRRSLTQEERTAFLIVADQDPRFILFELMLYCGCRPSEAVEVKYEDIVEIGRIPFLHIRGTKTPNSDRFVPLPKELWHRLWKTPLCGFCALTGAGKHYTETSYRRLVSRLKREMDIILGAKLYRNKITESRLATDFVPYLFRHTYCTDLKKKGVDLRIAKNLMGHADIKTTANIYDHDDTETLILAAEQMGISGGNPVVNGPQSPPMLDRAFGYGPKGREFESSTAR